MNEFWTIVLSTTGISTSAVAILAWLIRSLISERLKNAIKHEYDQKFETFKVQLKAESDVQIENLKSRLQIAAAERSVQYSHIYTRTAETLAEVYSRLIALRDAVGRYTSIFEWSNDPSKAERRQAVANELTKFQEYYKPRRIYIPRDLDDQIAAFANKLVDITVQFKTHVEEGRERPSQPGSHIDTWQEVDDYMTKESPAVLRALEDGFQKSLGMSSPDTGA